MVVSVDKPLDRHAPRARAATRVETSRIALFVGSLTAGGAERMMTALARGFAQRGLAVDFLTIKPQGDLAHLLPPEARRIRLKGRLAFAAVPDLALYLRRERPLALLATTTSPNVVALLAKKLARSQTRVVVREAKHPSVPQLKLSPSNALAYRLQPWVYRWADAVVAVSQPIGASLVDEIKIPRDLVHVLPNPTIGPETAALAAEDPGHPWLAPDQPPVILAVGRLHPLKDHATLLRAFARLRAVREARLIILGEGRERAALEQLAAQLGIAESLDLCGYRKNPLAFMSRARVLAVSSISEGNPNALVEAMACGLSVVATDCPGNAEVLRNGKLGRLVAIRDDEALAAALLEALDAPTPPELLHRRAADFSWERSVDAYLRVLLNGTDHGVPTVSTPAV